MIWLLSGLVGLALVLVFFVILPHLLVRQAPPDPTAIELHKARQDIRVAGIQTLGGILLLGGLFFTYQTIQVTRDGQITERSPTSPAPCSPRPTSPAPIFPRPTSPRLTSPAPI
jgi:hypothetical protein